MSNDPVVPPAGGRMVVGNVRGSGRQGRPDLFIEVIDRVVGPELSVGSSQTDADGAYAVLLDATTQPRPDLQVRVWSSAEEGATFIGESDIVYDAPEPLISLDVVVDGDSIGLEPEYDGLLRAAASVVDGRLGRLEESALRNDITRLAAKTGKDARALAYAMLADRLAAETDDAVAAPFFYALLRSGLPSAPEVLYRAGSATVESVWRRAVETGVVPRDLADQIPDALVEFERHAAVQLLGSRPTGLSSVEELLDVTFEGDADATSAVAALRLRADSDDDFWSSVAQDFPDHADRLRLDTTLAGLTLGNAGLLRALQRTEAAGPDGGLKDAADLARRGYFRADKWQPLLGDETPPVVRSTDPASAEGAEGAQDADEVQRRAEYAEFLAAQVRLSYPTAVIAAKVADGELVPAPSEDARAGVAGFLRDHVGRFELGVEPLRRFVAANDDVDLPQDPEIVAGIDRLQRLYQLTPDDDSLGVLLANGFDSANAVAAVPAVTFAEARRADLGESTARLVHARAEQITELVTNLAANVLTTRVAPPIGHNGGLLRPLADDSAAASGPAGPPSTSVLPTLEGLFGSLNSDACEHCGSVLSPAAYLVDLLEFLDVVETGKHPLGELLKRRPDLEHLPLTCKNTNALVPYIDLVNETLEYFITHRLSLTGFTGHDTPEGLTSAEALAGPTFVDDSAYALLQETWYPAPLPFHRHLEELRALFERLGVPLAQAMRVLRRDDERAPAKGDGWQAIAREQAAISPPLAKVLTDRSISLSDLLGFPDGTLTAEILDSLGSTRGWATHLSLSYAEIDRLLSSRFVNPAVALLPKVQALGVGFADLKALKAGQLSASKFRDMLPDGLDVKPYGGDVVAWAKDDERFRLLESLLVARQVEPAADDQLRMLPPYDEFVVRRVDPAATPALTALTARRLARFVRLWRHLGWSIEATDTAVASLLHDQADAMGVITMEDEQALDETMSLLLDRLGTLVTVLERMHLDPDEDLQALVACWAPLETRGPDAIYRRVFLTGGPTTVFGADSVGEFLTQKPKLRDHLGDVRAALGVSAADLADAAGSIDDNADLDLETVSVLFRHTWLASKLGIAQQDFERLVALADVDPFDTPEQPRSGMVGLLDLLAGLESCGVSVAEAVASLWPLEATSRQHVDGLLLRLVRDLRTRTRSADAALRADEPMGPERAGQLLEVRFGPAGRAFAALLSHALDVETAADPGLRLSEKAVKTSDGRLSHDPARQRIAYAGLMTTGVRDELQRGAPAGLGRAVDQLFALSEERRADHAFAVLDAELTRALLEYPEFRDAWVAYQQQAGAETSKGLPGLLEELLSDAKAQRRREDSLAAVASATGIERPVVEALLLVPDVLGTAGSGVEAIVDLAAPGLDRETHGNDATYSGWLDVATPGEHRLGVRVKGASDVSLSVGGVALELARNGDLHRAESPLALAADTMVEVEVVVRGDADAPVLQRQTGGQGWADVPLDQLGGRASLSSTREVLARCVAGAGVAATFGLDAAALRVLTSDDTLDVDGGRWLGAVPVLDSTERPLLGGVLEKLTDFARVVATVRVDAATVAGAISEPDSVESLLGWDTDDLKAVLAHRDLDRTALGDVTHLRRVAEAIELATSLATPVRVLLTAVTTDPNSETVHLVQSALRARHGAGWLEVLTKLSDPLRILRRDALVAYVLREVSRERPDIDTPEKLLDFFLMDVQMQPPVATSRVRHAISAVQLYVERILMNLEDVRAADLSEPERWQWLKRYRLWEANRQVYLWPENWLEPQLRTDQSPAFRRVMSELLQSDITEDSAAVALLGYLSQLEEVAKLEPSAIHVDEGDPNFGDEVSHVVARTPGAQRRYYYRQCASGLWTAWEHVGLDIEDNPVLPVIWRGRLLLFWLRIVNSSAPAAPLDAGFSATKLIDVEVGQVQNPAARSPKIRPKVVLCWSEYYNQRWQPPRTSDVAAPSDLGKDFDTTGPNVFERAKVRLGVTIEGGVLRVRIWGPQYDTSFLFYNTFSLPQREEDGPNPAAVEEFSSLIRDVDDTTSLLSLIYRGLDVPESVTRAIVSRNDQAPYRFTAPFHIGYQAGGLQQGLIRDPWLTPFLYSDGQHAFFVTTHPLTTDGAPGVGPVPVLPDISRVFPPLRTPEELGRVPVRGFPLDLLAGDPSNVALGDVEISPFGRTTRVTPSSQAVRHG